MMRDWEKIAAGIDAGRMLFVTGTDTSVGKTLICGLLLSFLQDSGLTVEYQKWVATGATGVPADLQQVMAFAGRRTDSGALGQQVPYTFAFPASPHFAAAMEGREIDPSVILESCRQLLADNELLLVEGVGGLLVPLRNDLLLADLLACLRPRTLIVARSGLGTINHTLLTLEGLRNRGIPVLGVVFSDAGRGEDEELVAGNMEIIAAMGKVPVFGRLPWADTEDMAIAAFKPMGEAILRMLGQ